MSNTTIYYLLCAFTGLAAVATILLMIYFGIFRIWKDLLLDKSSREVVPVQQEPGEMLAESVYTEGLTGTIFSPEEPEETPDEESNEDFEQDIQTGEMEEDLEIEIVTGTFEEEKGEIETGDLEPNTDLDIDTQLLDKNEETDFPSTQCLEDIDEKDDEFPATQLLDEEEAAEETGFLSF